MPETAPAVHVHHGDARELPLADASVDAIVCDPPYELGFMGKGWDATGVAYDLATWREAYRALKPGGHLLAFGGSRTWHRVAAAIEDVGFELRDSIAWLYGSGFPKSLDVSKAIDSRRDWTALPLLQGKVREARKALGISQSEAARRCGLISPDERLGGGGFMWFETGMRIPTAEQYTALKAALSLDDSCDLAFQAAEREVIGEVVTKRDGGSWAEQVRSGMFQVGERTITTTAPATPAAQQWQGWGTALKPGFEPIVVARKPLAGTVAQNVLAHGTGAINIDGCRIPGDARNASANKGRGLGYMGGNAERGPWDGSAGRWPTNVVLSHPPLLDDDGEPIGDACADGCVPGCPVAGLDAQSGVTTSRADAGRQTPKRGTVALGDFAGTGTDKAAGYDDSGGASRFFPVFRYQAKAPGKERPRVDGVAHPTVKPLGLMRWLVRLVTPPGGRVLDMFAGSGTTGEAALLEGFDVTLVEEAAEHLPLIRFRVDRARAQLGELAKAAAAKDDAGPTLLDLLAASP